MRVAFAFPSAEYPAICGVLIKALASNSRLISGSCSHTSIMASVTLPSFNASNRAHVSMTSPREVLMMTGFRFNDRKNVSSARWNVLYLPSLYKGTWNVMTSHSSANFCREVKVWLPSFSSRGKSLSRMRIPKFPATLATLLPTFPAPTIPIVSPSSLLFLTDFQTKSEDCTYWATEDELQPGALVHSIPAFLQYAVSM